MVANKKTVVLNSLYTAILAIAASTVLATTVLVAFKCLVDYGTLFKIVDASR